MSYAERKLLVGGGDVLARGGRLPDTYRNPRWRSAAPQNVVLDVVSRGRQARYQAL